MPLPLFLAAGAAIAGAAGIGSGIHGAVKMKEANDTMKSTERRHQQNQQRFEKQNSETTKDMDQLGRLEMEILSSFKDFCDAFEKIKNRPQFHTYSKNGVTIPSYDGEQLKEVSVGAGVLLGGIGGAAAGTAGGFAAAGATTAAVMALGTASTGTAIASLSGAAATNATLAALGGGSLAVGGGGMALGSTLLGAATLGVGLLVGGVIFNITGSSLSDKADEALAQMLRAEKEIDRICSYLQDLIQTAVNYIKSLMSVQRTYKAQLQRLTDIVNKAHKTNWNDFTADEKTVTENTILLVNLLYQMCKVELVKKAADENKLNTINKDEVTKSIADAQQTLKDKGFAA